jgi:hypothetical protein
MIDGTGRKNPRVSRSQGSPPGASAPGENTAGAQEISAEKSAEKSAEQIAEAQQHDLPKGRDIARRTLERLGQKVSALPVSEVPPEQRAGKTTALRAGRKRSPPRAYAAIDLGSSSGKMLIQRMGVDCRLRTVLDMKIGTSLGKGVKNGMDIPLENQERALDATKVFLSEAEKHGVAPDEIPLITTAVVRNSPNGGELLGKIHDLGVVRAKTLSGEEEAGIGFAGALAMMDGEEGRYATLDLGGGSFQLAIGTIGPDGLATLEGAGSEQIGSNVVLDEMVAPRCSSDGCGDPALFAELDRVLQASAPMPVDAQLLTDRTLVATGGVSKFLRAHFDKDVISAGEIDELRRQVLVMPYEARVSLVQAGKDQVTMTALGVETHQGALDYGRKLPASTSLLLHILRGIGVDEVRVSKTDARHALVQGRVAEARSDAGVQPGDQAGR